MIALRGSIFWTIQCSFEKNCSDRNKKKERERVRSKCR